MKEATVSARPSSRSRQKPEAGGRNGKEQRDNIRLAAYCRALAQPVRVRILKLLISEHCMFSDLSRRIPLAQSTISQHLKILAEAGLVEAATVGQSTCYCISENAIEGLKKMFAEL
jgi:ArsR family transcriptional regulator